MKKQKKLLTIGIFALVCAVVLPLIIGAASWKIEENPTTELQQSAPTVDGKIDATEGWSQEAKFDTDTVGFFAAQNPLTGEADMYFAYTEEGVYFAVDYTDYGSAYTVRFYDANGSMITEQSYPDANAGTYKYANGQYPTQTPDGSPISYYKINNYKISDSPEIGHGAFWNIFANDCEDAAGPGNTVCYTSDKTDKTLFGDYYWNGDTFSIAFDLCGKFLDAGFDGNEDHSQQYCIGVTEDGDVRIARTFNVATSLRKEITDDCQGKATIKDDGFVFEAFIPWDILVQDANNLAYKLGTDLEFTKEECIAPGATHRAAVTLRDMYIDENTGIRDEYGRYITVCNYLPNGTPGYLSCGDSIACYGLKLEVK